MFCETALENIGILCVCLIHEKMWVLGQPAGQHASQMCLVRQLIGVLSAVNHCGL